MAAEQLRINSLCLSCDQSRLPAEFGSKQRMHEGHFAARFGDLLQSAGGFISSCIADGVSEIEIQHSMEFMAGDHGWIVTAPACLPGCDRCDGLLVDLIYTRISVSVTVPR